MPRPTPIETPPRNLAPAQYPTPSETPSGLRDKRGATGTGLGRYDSSLLRSAEHGFAEGGINPDGLFFSQLLIPPLGDEASEHGFAGSSQSLPAMDEAISTQLIEELAQHLPSQAEEPLSFNLLLPNLGKIQVNAEKTDNRWRIQLGLSRRDQLQRLQGRSSACRAALEQAMGQCVDLHLYAATDL